MLIRPRLLVLLAVAVFTVAGCDFIPMPAGGPLVTVTTRGGKCADGPCGSTTVIERDGAVHVTEPTSVALGELSADVRTALDAAVLVADFDAIRARQFTGECPVNFDGQEVIFEFGAPGGTERIATCETEIDPTDPLFLAVSAAFAAVGAPLPVQAP
jgi:hypothetical protein